MYGSYINNNNKNNKIIYSEFNSMASFYPSNATKGEFADGEEADEEETASDPYHLYEEESSKYLDASNPDHFSDINKNNSKLIINDVKPLSYYFKLYNKKQMFELDNPTFLSNQYIRQVKLATKLNKANTNLNRSSDKYRISIVPEKKPNDESNSHFVKSKIKPEDSDHSEPALNSNKSNLINLNQKLIQEHKKIFSYNHFQQPSNLKHFIVNKPDSQASYISSSSNIMNKTSNSNNTDTNSFENTNIDTQVDIDIMADIKMVHSEQTDDSNSQTVHAVHEPQQPIYINRPKSSSSKPMNKLIKNLKHKFNFKKNIIDIKLPSAIAEAESPMPTGPPCNSRASAPNSANHLSQQARLNIDMVVETKKVTLHQQPCAIAEKLITAVSPSITPENEKFNIHTKVKPHELPASDHLDTQYRLPPPAQNREMLSRLYNACSRKLKKPKLKVKPANENNLEVVNEPNLIHTSNDTVKLSKLNKQIRQLNNQKYKLILGYGNENEIETKSHKSVASAPPVQALPPEPRLKRSEYLKIESSVSSFGSSNNYSMVKLGSGNELPPEIGRHHIRSKTNPNFHMNPVNLNDTLKDHIRNYRIRLDDINENLNHINTTSTNNFIVNEFIEELTGQKNSSEHEHTPKNEHHNQLLIKREKHNSSKFNNATTAATKSISVIDLSDLTEPDQRKSVNYNAFRPMRLNEYIKNTRAKQSKTLASFVIDKQQQQQHQQEQLNRALISRMADTSINNRFIQPVLNESYIKNNIANNLAHNMTTPSNNVAKVNSNPILSTIVNNDTSELFRREYSMTNESSHNSSMLLVSKKRVSFHEQVLETDVVSGSTTLKPITNYKLKDY